MADYSRSDRELTRARRGLSVRGGALRRAATLAAAVVGLFALLPATGAAADPLGQFGAAGTGSFTVGPGGYGASAITAGPDGNMWFTDNGNGAIGRIAPDGTTTMFPVAAVAGSPSGSGLFAITAGPDGNLWFTAFYANQIGRITPAGVITMFPVPVANSAPFGIAAGPDGNLWFTMDFANGIGRITPQGAVTVFPIPAPGATSLPPIASAPTDCPMCAYLITAGPDQSMWFTIPAVSRIGRISLAGEVTSFAVPAKPPGSTNNSWVPISGIATGSDGNLWFTEPSSNRIGRMTPAGAVTEFALPAASTSPTTIVPGPDANLWFASSGAGASSSGAAGPGASGSIARITPSGAVTPFTLPTANAVPNSVAIGPDGNAWFVALIVPGTGSNTLQIGTLGTGVGPILQARITGTAKVGSTLGCRVISTSGWTVAKVRFQWFRGARPIVGATAKTFTPDVADMIGAIRCRASVTYAPALNQLGALSTGVRVRR